MRASRSWIVAGALALALAVVAVLRLRHPAQAQTASPNGPEAERPTPVLVTRAERRDVPVVLEGLGTVTASNTVTVRPQVDGRLIEIAFQEGQSVHRGDLLARIDPRPFEIAVRQAEAVVARDRATLDTARRTLERTRALSAQQFVAPADLDTARGAVAVAEAAVRADEAQAAAARLSLSYTRITAPCDGVTGLRLVDAGNLVRANDTTGLVVITTVDPIAVVFTLPQDDLPHVMAQSSRAPLAVEVFSRDGDTRLAAGTLAVIDNQINASTATVRLKALFANAARALWPQQFVKARLRVDVLRGALVVPAAAVQRGPQGAFVYVVDGEQRARVQPVVVARVEGDTAVLTAGVQPGDAVVTEGQARLRAGARVQPRTPETTGERGARGARDGGVAR